MSVYWHEHAKAFIAANNLTSQNFRAHAARGSHTDYVLAAARDRGLRVEKLGMGHYFYQDDKIIGGMRSMLPSVVSSIAVSISANKTLTKSFLDSAGVPTPQGKSFKVKDFENASDYFQTFTSPVVVKPVDGSAGDGVSSGVASHEQFLRAWDRAARATVSYGSVLIEKHIAGIDVRAFVVGSRVVAAATRLPVFVIGDGKKTISTLVEEKRSLRDTNAYLTRMPIVIDDEWLETTGLSLEYVLRDGEVSILNPTVNLHQGGENIDITDQLCPELQEIAVRAAESIPGLRVAGIDLLVRSPHTAEGAVVLEANTKANIAVHQLPAYGDAVNVGPAIVDEMLTDANVCADRVA